jgi:hypothetical protein
MYEKSAPEMFWVESKIIQFDPMMSPGANPLTSEFIITYNASVVGSWLERFKNGEGKSCFKTH